MDSSTAEWSHSQLSKHHCGERALEPWTDVELLHDSDTVNDSTTGLHFNCSYFASLFFFNMHIQSKLL